VECQLVFGSFKAATTREPKKTGAPWWAEAGLYRCGLLLAGVNGRPLTANPNGRGGRAEAASQIPGAIGLGLRDTL